METNLSNNIDEGSYERLEDVYTAKSITSLRNNDGYTDFYVIELTVSGFTNIARNNTTICRTKIQYLVKAEFQWEEISKQPRCTSSENFCWNKVSLCSTPKYEKLVLREVKKYQRVNML